MAEQERLATDEDVLAIELATVRIKDDGLPLTMVGHRVPDLESLAIRRLIARIRAADALLVGVNNRACPWCGRPYDDVLPCHDFCKMAAYRRATRGEEPKETT